jgi:4,5-DOPA dioxygenase extradiol
MNNLLGLEKWANQLPNTPKMPILFLGHGSPMNAIEDNQFVKGFRNITTKIAAKPSAIICVSAHWNTRGTKITAMENPQTIYDFGGFPEQLYQVKYPAKGNPILAAETQSILAPTPVELDQDWGLDHGSWTVIKHLYPNADVPVLQLSIDYTQNMKYHFDLAKRLSSLREKGVLIVGSGNIIHNLGLVDFRNFDKDNYGFDWAIEAREGINKLLLNGDFTPLFEYQKLGKAYQLAIPTPDHFIPLLYVLGLKEENEKIEFFNDKLLAGSLSMTSLFIA